ncbi:AhpC/TSA antioxidant enzyme-domain-containing protein [Aspergillus avenaceus]|uniref:AhpC/TSA antioxidant enzyme-domain-containing protein n=1 Tax=Aspergillus avenaceus TaxID=36643 RepID=A0A5N6U618_ASPAV|nr:AhpC/TSA antioxidant enzyme-domain-containing protein [Aspergillus avenaceus]
MSETTLIKHDPIPDEQSLCDAYNLDLQSGDGAHIRFGELVAGKGDHITTVVIFIRHFFCLYDQSYVHNISRRLTESITPNTDSANPTQVILIGCGQPAGIVPYVTDTSAAFPLYTDPTGTIYEKLHMKKSYTGLTRPPSYAPVSALRAFGVGIKGLFKTGLQVLKGGGWNRNGGEWVFRDGKCVFVHRMQGTGDHLTADELVKVIGEDVLEKKS